MFPLTNLYPQVFVLHALHLEGLQIMHPLLRPLPNFIRYCNYWNIPSVVDEVTLKLISSRPLSLSFQSTVTKRTYRQLIVEDDHYILTQASNFMTFPDLYPTF